MNEIRLRPLVVYPRGLLGLSLEFREIAVQHYGQSPRERYSPGVARSFIFIEGA